MTDICEKYVRDEYSADGKLERVWFDLPDNFNFGYDVVDHIAKKEPQKRAIVFKSLKGDVTEYSFEDVSKKSSRIANMLMEQGIKRGDKVMLILKRRVEYWFATVALHKLGAVSIPTSNMVSHTDISYRIKEADIKCIICADDDHICGCVDKAIEAVKDTHPVIKYITKGDREGYFDLNKEMEKASDVFARQDTKISDIMLLYFTSGTTGEPKAVLHDFGYPLSHIVTARNWHGVMDNGLHFAIADSGWAKSAWGKIYGQWMCGSAVMVYDYEQFYANEILGIIENCKVNTFCAPPTIYKYLLREEIENYNLSSLKQATTAGEPMPIEIMKQFKERTGIQIRIGFGQTETAMITGILTGEEQHLDCIGKPSPMYRTRVIDEDGNEVKAGEPGELVILPHDGKGYPVGVFVGYFKDEKMYANVWRNGVYHTNDKVYYDENGDIYFVGRTDDVIKSSGYRIGPVEVENIIMKHPAVFECAVTGYPSETRGNIVKASIVLHKGYSPDKKLKVEIQDFVKERTAMYKYPRKVEFYDELPKTVSGKISREQIRRKDLEEIAKSGKKNK